jgi:integrase/recombinase XerD
MKRQAQPALSVEGQQALKQVEDLSAVTISNYLSELSQFMAWCERCWREVQDEQTIHLQAISPSLLIRYRTYLQTTLGLKPSSINRALMSLKRYFAGVGREQLIQDDPTSTVKFVPKEASAPRHLEDEEEDALVAAVNAHGTLSDRTIITLLLHTGLRAEELWTLKCKQVRVGRRNGMLRILGKRKKEHSVPFNATARSALLTYLETQPQERSYLFPLEKTEKALTERALGHLVTKYAKLAQVLDVSPHDLRHRIGYRMAEVVPLHQLAQSMGHNLPDTTMLYIRGTIQNLQQDVENAWI